MGMGSSFTMRIAAVVSLMFCVVFAPQASTSAKCAGSAMCQEASHQASHGDCCKDMACCLAKNKSPEPAQQVPRQKAGHDLAEAILSNPVAILFSARPVPLFFTIQDENRRGHSPDPLAAGCIRLI